MFATHRRRAAGFTMIELLVVVAILAVLAALSTGAYFRIRSTQQAKTTEDTVSKLTSAFTQQWTEEVATARKAFKGNAGYTQFSTQVDNTKLIAGGDVDRAEALWVYLWTKNAYPQTIAEATAATSITATVNGTPVTAVLAARPTFAGLTSAGIASPGDEAAVLLYRILTQKGVSGQTFNEEAIGTLSVTLANTNFKVFLDTFGNPISYVRVSSGTGDVNAPPYTKTGAGVTSLDPFDPTGRLQNWPSAAPPPPPRQQVAPGLNFPAAYTFNQNWLPTIVSRGPANNWGTFLSSTVGPIPIPNEYIAGYKLRRQGARGDQ